MQINPYLLFNGDCEAAFKFYEQHLGGKITNLITHAQMPMPGSTPPGWDSKILHATIELAGTTVMGSDAPPNRYKTPTGFMVSLTVHSVDEAEKTYESLKTGGEVEMPLGETPWAERFAMLRDQFGTPWIINLDKKQE